MSKIMFVKFFYLFGFVASSVLANAMPAESNVNDVITSQWKGGEVIAREADGDIIDIYPGYINIAGGRNCVLADNSAVRKPVLNECPEPGFTNTDPNRAVFLTIVVVPGNPGLCLAGVSGTVTLEPCAPTHRYQKWRYLHREVRPSSGGDGCLTANGLGNQLTLTNCTGLPAHSWMLP